MDETDARRLPNRVNLVWGYPRKAKKHDCKKMGGLFYCTCLGSDFRRNLDPKTEPKIHKNLFKNMYEKILEKY